MTKENKVEEKLQELNLAVAESAEQDKIVEPATVILQHVDPTAIIFYTTDGTYPVPNKTEIYKKPFLVYQDTLVKAVAVVGENVSPVFAHEFLVK